MQELLRWAESLMAIEGLRPFGFDFMTAFCWDSGCSERQTEECGQGLGKYWGTNCEEPGWELIQSDCCWSKVIENLEYIPF
jgi:hypothetical protein